MKQNQISRYVMIFLFTITFLISGCSSGVSSSSTNSTNPSPNSSISNNSVADSTAFQDGKFSIFGMLPSVVLGTFMVDHLRMFFNTINSTTDSDTLSSFNLKNNIDPNYFNVNGLTDSYQLKYIIDNSQSNSNYTINPESGFVGTNSTQNFSITSTGTGVGSGTTFVDVFAQMPSTIYSTTAFNPDAESGILAKYPDDSDIFDPGVEFPSESQFVYLGTISLTIYTYSTGKHYYSDISNENITGVDGSIFQMKTKVSPDTDFSFVVTPDGQSPEIQNLDGSLNTGAQIQSYQDGSLSVLNPLDGKTYTLDYSNLCAPDSPAIIVPTSDDMKNKIIENESANSTIGAYQLMCKEYAIPFPQGAWSQTCQIDEWDGSNLTTDCSLGTGSGNYTHSTTSITSSAGNYINLAGQVVNQPVTPKVTSYQIDSGTNDCTEGRGNFANGMQSFNCNQLGGQQANNYAINVNDTCNTNSTYLYTFSTLSSNLNNPVTFAKCANYNDEINSNVTNSFERNCTVTDLVHEPFPEPSVITGYCASGTSNTYVKYFSLQSQMPDQNDTTPLFCPAGQYLNSSLQCTSNEPSFGQDMGMVSDYAQNSCGNFNFGNNINLTILNGTVQTNAGTSVNYIAASCNPLVGAITSRTVINAAQCRNLSGSTSGEVTYDFTNQTFSGLACTSTDFNNSMIQTAYSKSGYSYLPNKNSGSGISTSMIPNVLFQQADHGMSLANDYWANMQITTVPQPRALRNGDGYVNEYRMSSSINAQPLIKDLISMGVSTDSQTCSNNFLGRDGTDYVVPVIVYQLVGSSGFTCNNIQFLNDYGYDIKILN